MKTFEQIAAQIRDWGEDQCLVSDSLHPDLCLYRDAALSVFYAPMEKLPNRAQWTQAKILFIGLTPSLAEARAAFREHFAPRADGSDPVSFIGTTRSNLIKILAALDIPRHLAIPTSAEIFTTHASLARTTSLLRYTVFQGKGFKNYGGSPHPLKHLFLKQMLNEFLLKDLQGLSPSTLVIPFGKTVEAGVSALLPVLPKNFEKQILWGFPHPSGANNGRVSSFLKGENKEMKKKISSFLS